MDKKIKEQIVLRIEEVAALFLWDIGAIKVNLDEPFQLVSGNYSPIYINCRLVISNPVFMDIFTAFAHTIFEQNDIIIDIVEEERYKIENADPNS